MKKKILIKPKPLGLLAIGALIVFIGAIAKILKEDFAVLLLTIGLIIEIIGLIYFINYQKQKKRGIT